MGMECSACGVQKRASAAAGVTDNCKLPVRVLGTEPVLWQNSKRSSPLSPLSQQFSRGWCVCGWWGAGGRAQQAAVKSTGCSSGGTEDVPASTGQLTTRVLWDWILLASSGTVHVWYTDVHPGKHQHT